MHCGATVFTFCTQALLYKSSLQGQLLKEYILDFIISMQQAVICSEFTNRILFLCHESVLKRKLLFFYFIFAVQYVIYIFRYIKEWRKNPKWSITCCLALLLPLNDLQGEIRGLTGRSILKQQLQTGKMDMPSMSKALKESGAVDFDLGDDEGSSPEEGDQDKEKANGGKRVEQGVLTLAEICIHPLPRETYDTAL